jgi:hypothetical protein
VVDRVGPVSVVAPELDDWDPALTCESVHVARWDLPTPGQLLGSQQWRSRGAHNVLYEVPTAPGRAKPAARSDGAPCGRAHHFQPARREGATGLLDEASSGSSLQDTNWS